MNTIENVVFGNRKFIIGLFAAITIALSWTATTIHFDTAFEKHLPLRHPYIQTFLEYFQEFGGGDRLFISIHTKQGDIFTAPFLETVESITNEVRFLPGVNRSTVRSIFTPNVRFLEIIEGGFTGGNVVPSDFRPTPEGLAQVRENIQKSGILGRFVAADYTAVMIEAQLLDRDSTVGKKLDYVQIASHLEEKIRDAYTGENVEIHITGFTKVVADIMAAAAEVITFFGAAFLVTAGLVYISFPSIYLSIIPLLCSAMTVGWTMGILTLLGFGIDPMSILVPFLIFAIGISHGLQMVNQFSANIQNGANNLAAARGAFQKIFRPGGIALATDALGFLTILLIDIQVIQEFAILAIIGVGLIAFTNLILLPVLLSYTPLGEGYRRKLGSNSKWAIRVWKVLGKTSEPKIAVAVIILTIGISAFGILKAQQVTIGNSKVGVPELHPNSRYNRDALAMSEKFPIGRDTLVVFAETQPEGCLDYEVMAEIDRFQRMITNIQGVTFTYSMPQMVKIINAGFHEGHPKWRTLPKNSDVMRQAIFPIEPSTGLLNHDCSVMPIRIFLENHKSETIDRVILAIETFQKEQGSPRFTLRLASGNVGITAATNQVVREAQVNLLVGIYVAIAMVSWLIFRSWWVTLCIILPLAFVSLMGYGFMHFLGIGLTISTLPVLALGVGIGVDYSIYIFSRLKTYLNEGLDLRHAYLETLQNTGKAVFVAGLTLATGVGTWVFSGLTYQSDMGLLLSFLFLANMLGALLLLPALTSIVYKNQNTHYLK